MYRPPAFAVDDPRVVLATLRRAAFGHLVTGGAGDTGDGLAATGVPFLVDDALSTVRAHLARANRHWRTIDGADGLLIVPGPDAYVSPRWYPSKAEHGRVVPTWNYEVVHLHGTITVHDDPAWTRAVVEELTDRNEAARSAADGGEPWAVGDAPDDFVDGQLRAIVGVALTVTRVEAKRKLSQNRSADDRAGAAAGLAGSDRAGDVETAALMRSIDPGPGAGR